VENGEAVVIDLQVRGKSGHHRLCDACAERDRDGLERSIAANAGIELFNRANVFAAGRTA
jgi:hypothetical protein